MWVVTEAQQVIRGRDGHGTGVGGEHGGDV